MGKTNKAWHEQNPMPPRATAQQRIDWHVAHAANCTCRSIPPGVLALIAAQERQPPKGCTEGTEAHKPAR